MAVISQEIFLGDELTCSICLCTFDCPVTTPCGHNFCQQCLLSTWKETYSCPQCRAHYSIKPELKKNTVLSAVVDTFKLRSTDVSVAETAKSEAGWGAAAIRCDTCMKAEAVNTSPAAAPRQPGFPRAPTDRTRRRPVGAHLPRPPKAHGALLHPTRPPHMHPLPPASAQNLFDPKTAHKRIVLTEHFTRASVSDQLNPAAHIDCPQRFSVCTQVLTSQGFTRGCHYWEVRLNHNNFIGIGLAYGSIDRKGPTSRLGRNAKSWCVEWFNVKLSAWHDSSEIKVVNPHPKRVGVLLDCDSGSATFYNVADRVYPFYSFVFPFTEAVYPAFWLFSSESSITLCQLQDRSPSWVSPIPQ
uniref:Tripartite motif containing 25 n=1 Tax=Hippocampus comes TaxID=109280 RepID=A0A3Q2Y0N3_HIPCM